MSQTAERYAVYFVPGPDTGLWQTGCRWLGRNPDGTTGDAPLPPQAADAGISTEEWAEVTAEPRRYGFHATLKPPFHLVEGCDLADLDGALARFAAGRGAFRTTALSVTRLAGFIALCPSGPTAGLAALAADCLRAFEPFRRPSDAATLVRRRARGLTPRQDALAAPLAVDGVALFREPAPGAPFETVRRYLFSAR